MTQLRAAVVMAAVAVAFAGCSRRPAPVPRPQAWPRVEVYEPEYRLAHFGPLQLAVNDSARLDSIAPGWFNIVYPAYGITVNCTLTDAENMAETIDNRHDRFRRNLGSRRARVMALPGSELIVAAEALKTPVQFIKTDSATYVLSGVAVSNWTETTNPDSVAPQINALAADLAFMLK